MCKTYNLSAYDLSTYEGRQKARKEVEKNIFELSDDVTIDIDNETIEALLFETVILEDGSTFKLPVWSGKFLEWLDLSKVDFSDVSWTAGTIYLLGLDYKVSSDTPLEIIEMIENYARPKVDLSDADISEIDLSSSYEGKRNLIVASDCDFYGIRLTMPEEYNPDNILFYNCNLFWTNFPVNDTCFTKELDEVSFYNCNLRNVDLFNIDIDLYEGLCVENDYNYIYGLNTNLCGTCANLICSKEFIEACNREPEDCFINIRQCFIENLQAGYYDDCYIEGIRITSDIDPEVLMEYLELIVGL